MRRARMKNSRRTDMKREIMEQEDMSREEADQRSYHDTFWGVDKEEHDRRQGIRDMAIQDSESASRESHDKLQLLHNTWKEERQQAEAQKSFPTRMRNLDSVQSTWICFLTQ